jgi:hypothetical protein
VYQGGACLLLIYTRIFPCSAAMADNESDSSIHSRDHLAATPMLLGVERDGTGWTALDM